MTVFKMHNIWHANGAFESVQRETYFFCLASVSWYGVWTTKDLKIQKTPLEKIHRSVSRQPIDLNQKVFCNKLSGDLEKIY